ncbi:hypothetical protein COCNU_scaffold007585G000020 [Cocos nucifera]|nr:hypothetical protein [Cocos nucifera]
MSDGGSQDGVPRKQAVLGDITNVCGKRPLSLDSEKNNAENKIGRYKGTQRTGFRDADFARKLREMVEHLTARKVNTGPAFEMREDVVDQKGRGVSLDNAKQPSRSVNLYAGVGTSQENVGFDVSDIAKATKDLSSLLGQRSDSVAHMTVEVDRLGNSHMPFDSVPGQGDRAKELSLKLEEDCQKDHIRDGTDSVRHTMKPDMDCGKSSASSFSNLNIVTLKGNNADGGECLTEDWSEESGFLKCLLPFGSLDFKMANMEGLLNANAASNVGSSINGEGNMGSEKSCTCSFCLKAAYMWTDLHYQDTRGRLAALKKSKRLARSLEARCYGHDYTSKTARDNSKKSTEIEFELMQCWRSLFLHTENVLVRETAHLIVI